MKFAALLFLLSSIARADDISCLATTAKDEFRPATLAVNCDGYASAGYIANDQKVTAVTLEISKGLQKNKVVIANPSQGIRSYYKPQSNEATVAELKKYGVKLDGKEKIYLSSFVVDSAVKLYKDSGPLGGGLANTPVLGKNDKPTTNASGKCFWQSSPQIISTPSCGGNNLCFGQVNCGEFTATATCQAIGSKSMECPSADTCASDETVKFLETEKSDPLPHLKGWDLNRSGGFHLDEGSAGEEAAKQKAKELNAPAN